MPLILAGIGVSSFVVGGLLGTGGAYLIAKLVIHARSNNFDTSDEVASFIELGRTDQGSMDITTITNDRDDIELLEVNEPVFQEQGYEY